MLYDNKFVVIKNKKRRKKTGKRRHQKTTKKVFKNMDKIYMKGESD